MQKHTMPNKRVHVIYSGSVQGVGFRWTAEHAALSSGVTGWVRNMPDGTVEVVCEGRQESIDDFLGRIKERMGAYIMSADINWEKPADEFDSFNIRF